MCNITTTVNIDDPVGGHQRSERLIGLATKSSWKYFVIVTVILSFAFEISLLYTCLDKITLVYDSAVRIV